MQTVQEKRARTGFYIDPALLKRFRHVRIDLNYPTDTAGIRAAVKEFVERNERERKEVA